MTDRSNDRQWNRNIGHNSPVTWQSGEEGATVATLTPPCEMISLQDHVMLVLQPSVVQSSWKDIEAFGAYVRDELENRKGPLCVIDLSPLSYMGSSIVALMVRVWKVVQARQGKMVVVCPHPAVVEVIRLAGLDQLWTLTPDVRHAQKSLGLKDPSPTATKSSAANLISNGALQASRVQDVDTSSPSPRVWYFTLGAIFMLAVVGVVLAVASRQ